MHRKGRISGKMGMFSRFYATEDYCQYGEDLFELSVIPMGCTPMGDYDTKDPICSTIACDRTETGAANLKINGASVGNLLSGDRSVQRFGIAPAFAGEAHYVIGTLDAGRIYNFRQYAPAWTYSGYLLPEALPTAKFGASVDLDGLTAVVGAPEHDDRGAAFVFTRDDLDAETWSLQATLKSIDASEGDQFGIGVAIDGDAIIVGAANVANLAGEYTGAAYIFDRHGTKWVQKSKLTAHDGADGYLFGQAVDISADTVAIGAPGNDAVYVYLREGFEWSLQEQFASAGNFGTSVSLDADTLLVGAPGQNTAYVYFRTDTSWSQQATLTADGRFGASVAVDGDWAVVGAPGANANTGAAYTFNRADSTGVWSQHTKLFLASSAPGDNFGNAVDISGERLVIGAYLRDVQRPSGGITTTYADEGSAYTYGLQGNVWQLQTVVEPLQASDGFSGDMVGYAVAIDDILVLSGAPQFNGRIGGIPTDGGGYIYITEFSPPASVTHPDPIEEVLAEANAQKLYDPVDNWISPFYFFDVPSFVLSAGEDDAGDPNVINLLDLSNTTDGIQMLTGTHLCGTGPIGGPLTFQGAGSLNPGSSPGYLAINGDLTLSSATYLNLEMEGLAPTTQHDQIQVVGVGRLVNLNDAVLNVDMYFVPTVGDSFVIIDNLDASTSIQGAFFGLPEGSTFTSDGVELQITYAGGDGNDVELLVVAVDPDAGSQEKTITVGEEGLTAYGMSSFDIQTTGGYTLIVLADSLLLPTHDKFLVRPEKRAELQTLPEGQALTKEEAAALYAPISNTLRYKAGGSNNRLVIPASDTDFTLSDTLLADGKGGRMQLENIDIVTLVGGPSSNTFTVVDYSGSVTLDGKGGSDRYIIAVGTVAELNLIDSGQDPKDKDRLVAMAPDSNDVIVVTDTAVNVNGVPLSYDSTTVEVLTVLGMGGDDQLSLESISVDDVTFDGGEGNDTYYLATPAGATKIYAFDTGNDSKGDDAEEDHLTLAGTTEDDHFAIYDDRAEIQTSVFYFNDSFEHFNYEGLAGNDTFEVHQTLEVGLTLDGQEGDDTYWLAGTADPTVFVGPVSINDSGPATPDIDYLLVFGTEGDDTVGFSNTGMTGIGADASILDETVGVEGLKVDLLGGDDTVTVTGAPAGFALYIMGNSGTDQFNVSSLDALPDYQLRLFGGDDLDTLNLDASAGTVGTLGETSLSGFGLLQDLQYGEFEFLNLVLSNADDTLMVDGWTTAVAINLTLDTLGGDDTMDIQNAPLDLNGGQFTKNGTGSLELTGENSYSGQTFVNAGTLLVNNIHASTDPMQMAADTTLSGSGTVDGSVIFLGVGTLTPQDTDPGGLVISGDLTLNAAVQYRVDLDGLIAVTEYDQMQVSGIDRTVKLDGAILNVDLTFVPVQGDRFVIIDNTDTDTDVAGTFQGLPEGSTLMLNGVEVFITYQGGDGNDVEILLADTYITLDNGNLLITDVGGTNGDTKDNLTIQSDVANQVYIIHDPDNVIAAKDTPGSEWVDLHTVKIPFAQVTGDQIRFELLDLADQLTIDFSLGDFAKTIISDGGVDDQADTLNINDQGSTADHIFTLTGTTLDRSDTAQISYTNFENLNLNCGLGNDIIDVTDTHAGSTSINAGGGDDTINLQTISGATTINAGEGDDVINVSSDAPANLGTLNNIAADLTVNGDAGADTLNVSDLGDATNNAGSLTGTQLTGFGMASTLTYGSLEELNIQLGTGNDLIDIMGTHTPSITNLDAGLGNDIYRVYDNWGDIWISDQGGIDWFDYRPAQASLIFMIDNAVIVRTRDGGNALYHYANQVEHLIGGSGNDWFIMVQPGAKLAGGRGTITGGLGYDTISYEHYATYYHPSIYNGVGLAAPADVERVILPPEPPEGDNVLLSLLSFYGDDKSLDELIDLIKADPNTYRLIGTITIPLNTQIPTAVVTHAGHLVVFPSGLGGVASVEMIPGSSLADFGSLLPGMKYLDLSGRIRYLSENAALIDGLNVGLSAGNGAFTDLLPGEKIVIIFQIPVHMLGFDVAIMWWDAARGLWREIPSSVTPDGRCIAVTDLTGTFVLVAKD